MAIQNGSLVLLRIKNSLNEFITIGGLRTTKFTLNNQLIDCTNKNSGPWKEVLSEAGLQQMIISGAGVFTDSKSEQIIRDLAFSNADGIYQIIFGNGDIVEGKFLISTYERYGNYNEEESYNITLESSGKILYVMQKT